MATEPDQASVTTADLGPLEWPVLEAVRTGGVVEVRAAVAAVRGARQEIDARSHAYDCNGLELAIAMGKLDVAETLLDLGADPSDWSCNDSTPLSAALSCADDVMADALDLLIARGARARVVDVHAAARTGRLDVLDRIRALPIAADDERAPHTDEELHAVALAAAASSGEIARMEDVLARAPELRANRSYIARAAAAAMTACQAEAWRMLEQFDIHHLEWVADGVEAALARGRRDEVIPLVGEALERHPGLADALLLGASSVEIIDLALAHGGSPNARDAFGRTPLMLAASTRHVAGVERLARAGADPTLVDSLGHGAWAHAHKEIFPPAPEMLAALRALGVPETAIAQREDARLPAPDSEWRTQLWALRWGLTLGAAIFVGVFLLRWLGLR